MDRAAVLDETTRQTIFAAQRDVKRETAVPTNKLKNRVRSKKITLMAEPISLTGSELPLALQKTHDGEQFLLHDFGPQDEDRVIVFPTLPGLDILGLSDDWFC